MADGPITERQVDLRYPVLPGVEREPTGTYTLPVVCSNCRWKGKGVFWRGQAAQGRYTCPACGCRTLNKGPGDGW